MLVIWECDVLTKLGGDSVAAACYLLSWFQTVLVPFFLAIFLMYVGS